MDNFWGGRSFLVDGKRFQTRANNLFCESHTTRCFLQKLQFLKVVLKLVWGMCNELLLLAFMKNFASLLFVGSKKKDNKDVFQRKKCFFLDFSTVCFGANWGLWGLRKKSFWFSRVIFWLAFQTKTLKIFKNFALLVVFIVKHGWVKEQARIHNFIYR